MTKSKPKAHLAFVVDCGRGSGMGHLFRSHWLAKTLFDTHGFGAVFYLSDRECGRFIDFPAYSIERLERSEEMAVVFDGISFGENYINGFSHRFDQTVVIDDLGARNTPANIIINPNLFAKNLDYSFQSRGQLLLGGDYALINPRFGDIRERERAQHRALVTFGGGATARLAIEVATELSRIYSGDIDVALGSFELTEADRFPASVRFHSNADMLELMSNATIYIGSLGTSFLEAQAAGLSCVVSAIVDNQEPVIDAARKLGASVVAPFNPKQLALTAKTMLVGDFEFRGTSPVDGRGVFRAADAIAGLVKNQF